VKDLAERRRKFHTHKLKEETNCRAIFKDILYSINPDDIKIEIEKIGNTVTNIWNIKEYRSKLNLSMIFVDLKPTPNNNKYIQHGIHAALQNKIPTAQKQNGYCSMCNLPNIWEKQKILSPQTDRRQMRW
jgi:hypothetical protein